jgi:hypothetical protein
MNGKLMDHFENKFINLNVRDQMNVLKRRFFNSMDDILNDKSSDEDISQEKIEITPQVTPQVTPQATPSNMEKDKNINQNKSLRMYKCDFCKKGDLIDYRYKCLICDDYDLCGKCFESRKINKNHYLKHPMVRYDYPGELFGTKFKPSEINLAEFVKIFKYEIHQGIRCNFCSMSSIHGLRFKCDICNNFDLCYECYKKDKSSLSHSSHDHPLIVHGKTQSLEIDENSIEKISVLGSGGFGTVYKSRHKNLDNKIVACKVIKLEVGRQKEGDLVDLYKSYTQELNAYTELKGVNILRMFGHCIQKTPDSFNLMIITEFMSKGSLKSLLEKEPDLSFRRRFDIVCDVAAGMARIHEHHFIHRDIRPDNILVNSYYTAKIGDMGIAKFIPTNMNRNTLIGCPPFMPPEFHTGNYDQKLDIFTFGLTLNIIFNGRHNERDRLRHYEIIKRADVFREYINACISPNPTNRPTSKIISEKFQILRKLIEQEIFTKEMFPIYKQMTMDQKNEHFKILYDKFMRNKECSL